MIKRRLDTEEARAFWSFVDSVIKEVEGWSEERKMDAGLYDQRNYPLRRPPKSNPKEDG